MLYGAALLSAAALAAEGGLLVASRRAATGAAQNLGRKNQEWRALAAQNPAPTATQAASIEADVARADAVLRALEARLQSRDAMTPRPPVSRTDAFFDLTGFVQAMGEQAARAGVGVKAGERFGFSSYIHDGPPPALLSAIDRQRRIATILLEALFAAHPARIEGVQREDPERAGADGARRDAGNASGPADVFAMDSRLSVRVPGAVDATAFRLTFTGQSMALRRFLNRLTADDIPAVARSIVVEPTGETPPRRAASPDPREPLALAVRAAPSRFTVTVEFCEILGPSPSLTGKARPTADTAGASGCWPEPRAQPRGREWLYDLFTPPAVYCDPQGPTLRAASSADPAAANPGEAPPDLQLLQVRRGPFRLQLVGYAGGPDDLRGIFADAASGETVVGRSGERLAGQHITVRRLSLERRSSGAEGDTTGREPAAFAVVAEDGASEEVELSNREPCLAGTPVGLFASRRLPGLRHEAGAGESFALDGASYCVEQIDLRPPQAIVACAPGAGPPIRKIIPRCAPPETAPDPGPTAEKQGGTGLQNTP